MSPAIHAFPHTKTWMPAFAGMTVKRYAAAAAAALAAPSSTAISP
jgi:hypothetical protein